MIKKPEVLLLRAFFISMLNQKPTGEFLYIRHLIVAEGFFFEQLSC